MANFLKITLIPDAEFIIDVDKIEWMSRICSKNIIKIGGDEMLVTDNAYEKIKERIFHPFGTPHKT